MPSIDSVNVAPDGTKIWLLNLGILEADDGFFIPGGNASSVSNPNPTNKRRKLVCISVLIEHPTEGLVLFETGSGKDYPEVWGPPLNDIFARVDYQPEHELDAAIAKTGHSVKDIKAVIMGHLHLDHAGGLEYFRNTGIPIYVHEKELKHAFYSVATKTDLGVYLPQHLEMMEQNWQPMYGEGLELAPGLNIRHSPGHTPGLCILQVNLKNSGTWIFTTDQYHVSENYDDSTPQGWLARDHEDWHKSHRMIKGLKKMTGGKIVFGHCMKTFDLYKHAPEHYD